MMKIPLAASRQRPPKPAEKKHPAITIDDAVAHHGLVGPYLLKLDTHGFEVPIIEGAIRNARKYRGSHCGGL